MTLMSDAKFEEKLALCCKNDMTNLVNFTMSSGKSENSHFYVLLWLVAFKVSAKKVQKGYLSWHWRAIQTSKKKSLSVWKMTWIIWWILTRAVKKVHFDGIFLSKLCNVWARKIQTSCVAKNDLWFHKWHNEFGEFSQ